MNDFLTTSTALVLRSSTPTHRRLSVDDFFVIPTNADQNNDNTNKINYWIPLPVELHHKINDFLSVYDSFALSSANHFLRVMFFTVALRPNYKLYLEKAIGNDEQTLTGKVILFIAHIAQSVRLRSIDKELTHQQIFEQYEVCRKLKYHVCDERGLKRLSCVEGLRLDDLLIKIRIANGELTYDKAALLEKNLFSQIFEALEGNLAESERGNLIAREVQACLFVEFFTIPEAKALSVPAKGCIKLKIVQKAIGNHQLLKETVLNFNDNVYKALKLLNEEVATNKLLPTIDEAIQYPAHTQILFTRSLVKRSILDRTLSKQDLFLLRQDQIYLALRFTGYNHLSANDCSPDLFKRHLNWSALLTPDEIKTLRLDWVEINFQKKDNPIEFANQIRPRSTLLLKLEQKHGSYFKPLRDSDCNWYDQGKGVSAYLRNVWGIEMMCKSDIIVCRAAPEIVRALFLNDSIEKAIAPLIKKEILSVPDILSCSLEKIGLLSNNQSVRHALETNYLTSQDISQWSAEQILDKAEHTAVKTDSNSNENCLIQ